MKTILIIGLGRFGRHCARKLNELGHQVMAVDVREDSVMISRVHWKPLPSLKISAPSTSLREPQEMFMPVFWQEMAQMK